MRELADSCKFIVNFGAKEALDIPVLEPRPALRYIEVVHRRSAGTSTARLRSYWYASTVANV